MFSILRVIGFIFALWLGMGWLDEEMKKVIAIGGMKCLAKNNLSLTTI